MALCVGGEGGAENPCAGDPEMRILLEQKVELLRCCNDCEEIVKKSGFNGNNNNNNNNDDDTTIYKAP